MVVKIEAVETCLGSVARTVTYELKTEAERISGHFLPGLTAQACRPESAR